jgi:hypothetical protein
VDIAITNNDRKKWGILDAKYYDFIQSPPGWHDIVKQFYYKRVLSETMGVQTHIENFFVAPKNMV